MKFTMPLLVWYFAFLIWFFVFLAHSCRCRPHLAFPCFADSLERYKKRNGIVAPRPWAQYWYSDYWTGQS